MKVRIPKGTRDMLPEDAYKWHFIEDLVRRLTSVSGYREIRTPIFEHTELFMRGVGDTTDIVQKEMYTFADKGHRSLTLKPEGTAGVVRALVESGMAGGPLPVKMYYLTPVFRYERPQSGRLREHHQFGVEVFGAADATMDAEVIDLAWKLLEQAGLQSLALKINSIGCAECRPRYQETLRKYLESHRPELCKTCGERIDKNPLRVLDCKVDSCRPVIENAPLMLDHLCENCRKHFELLKCCLTALNLPWIIDPRIVRGLDYYTRTVFEIVSDRLGAQSTVCGGGRYDNLVAQIDGSDIPGVGFGMGIERLLLTLKEEGVEIPRPPFLEVFIAVHGGDSERLAALQLVERLRMVGIAADMDHTGRSIKAQFKYAGKLQVPQVVVIGEREIEQDTVLIRNMRNGEEMEVRRDRAIDMIRLGVDGNG